MFKSIVERLGSGNNLPVVIPAVDLIHIPLFVLSLERDLVDLEDREVEGANDRSVATIVGKGLHSDLVSNVEVGELVDCDGLGFFD